MTTIVLSGILLLGTLFSVAHGQTYLESLHRSLIPVDLRFDYDIRLLYIDGPQTIYMCGNDVSVRRLDLLLHGVQAKDGQTALARSASGSEPNLTTSVYRVQPEVTFISTNRNELEIRSDSDDKFCFFMFDAGLASHQWQNDAERLMDANRPFIHWAVCNIQDGDLSSGDTLVEYMPVPATGSDTKRIVWVLMKQGNDEVTSINSYVPESCPVFATGRCQFDIAEFVSQNAELEVVSVLTTRAAPDVVGLNMMRPAMTEDELCALYTDITKSYTRGDHDSDSDDIHHSRGRRQAAWNRWRSQTGNNSPRKNVDNDWNEIDNDGDDDNDNDNRNGGFIRPRLYDDNDRADNRDNDNDNDDNNKAIANRYNFQRTYRNKDDVNDDNDKTITNTYNSRRTYRNKDDDNDDNDKIITNTYNSRRTYRNKDDDNDDNDKTIANPYNSWRTYRNKDDDNDDNDKIITNPYNSRRTYRNKDDDNDDNDKTIANPYNSWRTYRNKDDDSDNSDDNTIINRYNYRSNDDDSDTSDDNDRTRRYNYRRAYRSGDNSDNSD